MRIRLVLALLGFSSVGFGSEPVTGMTESALLAAKGAPDGKIIAGRKALYRYPDMVVHLTDARIVSIQKRDLQRESEESRRLVEINAQAAAKKPREGTGFPGPASVPPRASEPLAASASKGSVSGFGPIKGSALANALRQLPPDAVQIGLPTYAFWKGDAGKRDDWRCTVDYEVKAITP